ncbi:GNAT family N-acetyltransferase [Lewinella sp. IMCC34183]|uniref:GNAT family N-acetyltransferase n=1 Tax=Lewinella sp. IMCC34183 TaxID=2248762 RepID=UPI0013006C0D|nr:GNAT family N-acetyltransferase [Lewinella sp. IMCC34183]
MTVRLLQPLHREWADVIRHQRYRGYPAEEGALPERVLIKQYLLGAGDDPLSYRYGVPFLVLVEEHGKIVGNVGGKGWLPDEEEVEVGYQTARDYRGRGIMTAALKIFRRKAEADEISLIAHIEQTNGPSRRVLQKSGFSYDAMVRLPDSLLLERWGWSPDQD